MPKFQCLLFVLQQSYICYYNICMTVTLSEISPYKRILLKNQNLKKIHPPKRDSIFIKPRSCFWWEVFSHINVSLRFARAFLFTKCMCGIFKDAMTASLSTFTCSKLITKTLEQGVEYVQS